MYTQVLFLWSRKSLNLVSCLFTLKRLPIVPYCHELFGCLQMMRYVLNSTVILSSTFFYFRSLIVLITLVPMKPVQISYYTSLDVLWNNVPLKSFIIMSPKLIQTIPCPSTILPPVEQNGGFKFVPLPRLDDIPFWPNKKKSRRTIWKLMEFVFIGTKMKICGWSWVEICIFILTFPL